MNEEEERRPTRAAARRIAEDFHGGPIATLDRYETGLCHWVYRCEPVDGSPFVLRVARPANRHYITGGLTISRRLADRGVPVAGVLGGEAHPKHLDFPWMAIEHLPGRDLGEVYNDLSDAERASLASRVAGIQREAAALTEGVGFGYTHEPGAPGPKAQWDHVLDQLIDRSLDWLAQSGLQARSEAALVQSRLDQLRPTLARIEPTPFLDDLTTKNVLVQNGELAGIVDVDEICLGDPVHWLGLTRMSLLNAGYDSKYIDLLLDACGADAEARRRCDFYTGLYAFVFLSEQGVPLNDQPGDGAHSRIRFLRSSVRRWLGP